MKKERWINLVKSNNSPQKISDVDNKIAELDVLINAYKTQQIKSKNNSTRLRVLFMKRAYWIQLRNKMGGQSSLGRRVTITKKQKKILTNTLRSGRMKAYWSYLKAIQTNYYPDMSLKEIRKEFGKRRKNLDSEIPDVAWKNPSP